MDPITQQQALASAGAAGTSGDKVYVDDVFSTYAYDGTGSAQTITNGIDISGEGGLVWIKRYDGSQAHTLGDTERTNNKVLRSDNDGSDYGGTNYISAYNSNGFSIGTDSDVNGNNQDYVSWTFRKAPGFFDVVTYTGDGNASQQIAHSLGSVPGMVVVKNTSNSGHWVTNHVSTGAGTGRLFLNLTNESSTGSAAAYWNSTAPTSTHFTVGADSNVNANGDTFVAYIFANDDQSFGEGGDEAIIKCGTYTGNGTSQVINLGFEAQWVVVKCSNDTGEWYTYDAIRDMTVNGSTSLKLNHDGAPSRDTSDFIGPSPNGFTANGSGGGINYNNDEFVYMAIRRSHKPPEAGTEVFSVDDQSSGSGSGGVSFSAPSFPIDLLLTKRASSNADWKLLDRMRGYDKCLITNDNSAESTESYLAGFDQNSGYTVGSNGGVLNESDTVTWCFKRANGFFDIINYIGNSPNSSSSDYQTITHNLGTTPELILVKNRENSWHWSVYSQSLGNSKRLVLNLNDGEQTDGTAYWTSTSPTATTFTVGYDPYVNKGSDHHIAYLFATLAGISKVGTYTGTGNDIDINCGFTSGARFVMVKRTDSTGDWFVMDSTRGITAGDDPYALLNSTAAEVNNNSVIDADSSGFQITGDAPAGMNASGGTYLYLAIA